MTQTANISSSTPVANLMHHPIVQFYRMFTLYFVSFPCWSINASRNHLTIVANGTLWFNFNRSSIVACSFQERGNLRSRRVRIVTPIWQLGLKWGTILLIAMQISHPLVMKRLLLDILSVQIQLQKCFALIVSGPVDSLYRLLV